MNRLKRFCSIFFPPIFFILAITGMAITTIIIICVSFIWIRSIIGDAKIPDLSQIAPFMIFVGMVAWAIRAWNNSK